MLSPVAVQGAAAPRFSPKQMAGLVHKARAAELAALKALDKGDLKGLKGELTMSMADLAGAEGSSALTPGYGDVTASLKGAANADEAALGGLPHPAERGRVRRLINTAIVRKDASLAEIRTHTTPPIVPPPPPVTAPPPANLRPVPQRIEAVFFAGSKETTHSISATDPDGDKLSYAWTLHPPQADRSCNNLGHLTSAAQRTAAGGGQDPARRARRRSIPEAGRIRRSFRPVRRRLRRARARPARSAGRPRLAGVMPYR